MPLTHWGRDQIDAISQTTFWNAFSWMKMYELRLRYHWSLFLMVQLTIFQHWFRKWLGAVQATSHYLNQWWLDYRRIYASLGLNELMPIHLGMVYGAVTWTMFYYHQLNSRDYISMKLYSKYDGVHSRQCVWKWRLQYVSHFVPSAMCQINIWCVQRSSGTPEMWIGSCVNKVVSSPLTFKWRRHHRW